MLQEGRARAVSCDLAGAECPRMRFLILGQLFHCRQMLLSLFHTARPDLLVLVLRGALDPVLHRIVQRTICFIRGALDPVLHALSKPLHIHASSHAHPHAVACHAHAVEPIQAVCHQSHSLPHHLSCICVCWACKWCWEERRGSRVHVLPAKSRGAVALLRPSAWSCACAS